jgi:superfamily II DNA/RNA helicase
MAPGHRWQDPIGLETINVIVKKIVPTWTNGLHPVQLELVSGILDGEDILCCTATGDGKSAAFTIPCLILVEYNKNPEVYPAGFPTRKRPIGIVITPKKGIANNIVCFSSASLNYLLRAK